MITDSIMVTIAIGVCSVTAAALILPRLFMTLLRIALLCAVMACPYGLVKLIEFMWRALEHAAHDMRRAPSVRPANDNTKG